MGTVERGISANSCSAGAVSSISSSSIAGDDSIAAGRFSGEVFDTVAADMDRNEELGETLTGGRGGGLIDPPNLAAAALTFEGVDSIATGEVVDSNEAFVGRTGDNGRSSNSSAPIDLESSSSPNSNSSNSFILGLVGVIVGISGE
jgi:hypothetical protein